VASGGVDVGVSELCTALCTQTKKAGFFWGGAYISMVDPTIFFLG
jgi:hypothetical protein